MKKKILVLSTIFMALTATAQEWGLNGNTATTANFLGTTNNTDLVFKANNVEAFRVRASTNTVFYGAKIIYDQTLKLKAFKNSGADYDRLIAIDKVGNVKLAITPRVDNLTVFNTFSASNGITFGDGTVQTTASKWLVNGQNTFFDAGNVGIGTNDTRGYKLAVRGGVIAENFVVKLYANWPDFVFSDTYKLQPLSALETYIDENKHLPNVPSEKEVSANGFNLGEMDAILLQKIEELTLYTIEQQKLIDKQGEIIEKLLKNSENN